MEEEEVTVVEEAVDIGGRIEEVAIEDHMRAVGDVVEATLHITMSPDTLAVVQVDTILAVTGWKTLIRNHIDQKVLQVIPTAIMVVVPAPLTERG